MKAVKKYLIFSVCISLFGLTNISAQSKGTASKQPSPDHAFFSEGLKCDKQDYDCQISNYTKAINLKLNTKAVFKNRGYAYMGKEEYPKAIADFSKAIELDKNDAEGYKDRGKAIYALAQSDEMLDTAIDDFTSAAELEPKDAEAYKFRGIAYFARSNFDKAKKDLERALILAPDDRDIIAMLSEAEMETSTTNISQTSDNKLNFSQPAEVNTKALDEIRNSMVLIPAGTFMMGSNNGDGDEKPVRSVTISNPFYMGKYEVTQGQWRAVMGSNPSHFKRCGQNCPVEMISWNDIQEFLKRMNARKDEYVYTLPTEAQWEYAARAGSTGDYGGTGRLDEMGWHDDNSASTTHPVGQKQPNAFGLFDMHGNVSEFIQDWNVGYTDVTVTEPVGPKTGHYRFYRGSNWNLGSTSSRSAHRVRDTMVSDANARSYGLGFRLAAVPSEPATTSTLTTTLPQKENMSDQTVIEQELPIKSFVARSGIWRTATKGKINILTSEVSFEKRGKIEVTYPCSEISEAKVPGGMYDKIHFFLRVNGDRKNFLAENKNESRQIVDLITARCGLSK